MDDRVEEKKKMQLVAETTSEEIKRAHEDFMQRSKPELYQGYKDYSEMEAILHRIKQHKKNEAVERGLFKAKYIKEKPIISKQEMKRFWEQKGIAPVGKWTQRKET